MPSRHCMHPAFPSALFPPFPSPHSRRHMHLCQLLQVSFAAQRLPVIESTQLPASSECYLCIFTLSLWLLFHRYPHTATSSTCKICVSHSCRGRCIKFKYAPCSAGPVVLHRETQLSAPIQPSASQTLQLPLTLHVYSCCAVRDLVWTSCTTA